MERRKFIQSTLAASALPLGCVSSKTLQQQNPASEKELYEIRTYEMKFGSNASLLMDYLKDSLQPALEKLGVNHFMLFNELGNEEPRKLWVLISYPDATTYLNAQKLTSDAAFLAETEKYNTSPANQPIYNRFSSSLLLAFDGMKTMMQPVDGASIFELRTYEGYNEDAVRRKVKMFNVEEITLFLKVGLHPVLFGEMIAGPYRPSLVYLLNFKDMAERDANWKTFVDHPEWNAMKVKEEYINSVSNIRKVFLKPI